MSKPLHRSVIAFAVVLVLFVLAWANALRTWSEVASSPERLSMLLSDFPFIVLPGALGVYGVLAHKPWGGALFIFALAALLYGTARTVALLYWDNYFHVPWIGAFLVFVALLGFAVYALRAVVMEPKGGP